MKWDHTTSPSNGTDLDKMSNDGWELVAVAGAIMYWKRPAEVAVATGAVPALAAMPAPMPAPKSR